MPRVSFTPNLRRHLDAPPMEVAGDSVAAVFEQVFRAQPELRGYLLDDQGSLRHHVAVFVDGNRIRDTAKLSDAVAQRSEVCVVQALSGG
jgi:sulfur-carrier protein